MNERIEELFELVGDGDLYRYEASEKVIELADDFAIGFADWLMKTRFQSIKNIKTEKLLEIYKKEKWL